MQVALRSRCGVGILLLTVIAVVTLAACGSSKSSSSSSPSSSSSSSAAPSTSSLPATYTGVEAKVPTQYPIPTLKPGLHPKVAFLVVANNESNVGEVNAVRAQAKKLGVEVTILYDNANVDKQVTDFNTALAKKVDAIVFYPLDPKALGPSIAQAQKKGVKLFATDAVWGNLPVPAGITSVMLFNRDRAAYMQAQEMAKLKPHAKIVVMNFGGAPVPALAYYTSRAKYWAAQAGLTVLGEQDNPTDDVAGAQQAMSALLGKFSNIDGIIAYNDPSALGAYAAARSAGRMIIAIGQNGGSDARSGVQHGQEAASVFINTPAEGVNFLNGIYDLMANPSVKLPPELAPLPALMTKDTLNSVPSYEKAVAEIQSSSSLAPPAS